MKLTAKIDQPNKTCLKCTIKIIDWCRDRIVLYRANQSREAASNTLEIDCIPKRIKLHTMVMMMLKVMNYWIKMNNICHHLKAVHIRAVLCRMMNFISLDSMDQQLIMI